MKKNRSKDFTKDFKIAVIHDNLSPSPHSILITSAKQATPKVINKILNLGGNTIFVAVSPKRAKALRLLPMPKPEAKPLTKNKETESSLDNLIFTSVESRTGVTTGISASDRTATINAIGSDEPNVNKLISPGHIFPVLGNSGGSLEKCTLVNAALDIANITFNEDAIAYSYLLNKKGDTTPLEESKAIAKNNKIPHFLISEIIEFRLINEPLIKKVSESKLPSAFPFRGAKDSKIHIFNSKIDNCDHVALTVGDINFKKPVLIRVQKQDLIEELFLSRDGNSPETNLDRARKAIEKNGSGILVYLKFDRPNTIAKALEKSCSKNEKNQTSLYPYNSMRQYGIGAQILRDLGVKKIKLLSNSEKRLEGIFAFGLEISEIVQF